MPRIPRSSLPDREEIRDRLDGFLNPPLTLAGAAIALVVVCQIVAPPGVLWGAALWAIAAGLYVLILLDFASKLALSRDRAAYLRTHWPDAVFAVLPVLRPLTYLRRLHVYRLIESLFALFFGRHPDGRTARLGMTIFKRRQLGKLGLSTLVLTLIFAELFYLAEINAKGSQISSFGGALWFTASYITTVGSEVYPVTFAGRLVGWALMIYAVTVFTYLAASLASVMVGGDRQQSGSDQSDADQSGSDQTSPAPASAPAAPTNNGARSSSAPSKPSERGTGDDEEQARELLRQAEELLARAQALLGPASGPE
ncbi:potassium channel family protein [Sinomonas terrae]|uniref:Potassium channel family protein n=1 Tax=Sinomonas terrae TaxID=2908838 RepID=A0ABS9TYG7_9MICC|nr:potassium channel family protein [Sinomonas terrae]MCH6469491.1 potassium channel family protein [Sinomonas terrae]